MGNQGPQANLVSHTLPITHQGKWFREKSRTTLNKFGRLVIVFQRRFRTLLLSLLLVGSCAGLASPVTTRAAGSLVFSPSSANFGTVAIGASKTLTVTIKNIGTTTVTFAGESLVANNYAVSGFVLPASLATGKTLILSIRFTPRTAGTAGGYIRFDSNASNALVEYQLTGVGSAPSAQLTPTPATANLGSAPIGTTNSQVIQLKNNGASVVSISGATLSGSSEFKLCKLTYPLNLAAGQIANCTILFTPFSTGSVSGTLVFSSNATDKALAVPLSGQGVTATRVLTATPTSLNFGNVIEGKSETIAVNLKNTGNSTLVVSGITTSNTSLSTSGGVQGAAIAPGQSATLKVTYSPTQVGAQSGSVSIASNAIASPIKISIAGEGISGAGHAVNLNWKPSLSSGIEGYNVYRATLPDKAYVKITSSIILGTTFSDPGVVSGQTYSYEVTAVSTHGEESSASAAVSAAIP